ncbi:hypothetical protein P280DRAFT_480641 [Massarina eburnea CBS 473.64]|uniref:Uncharacterized protein n=1 Tax=Massarina eburnea CBS 473.64 TaxID=1395130 RepID=A0A6A6S0E9_9PLEO|nr:hypothetical protein P280DRAFT_480641 [Massarina eburnea CBS 473.64]
MASQEIRTSTTKGSGILVSIGPTIDPTLNPTPSDLTVIITSLPSSFPSDTPVSTSPNPTISVTPYEPPPPPPPHTSSTITTLPSSTITSSPPIDIYTPRTASPSPITTNDSHPPLPSEPLDPYTHPGPECSTGAGKETVIGLSVAIGILVMGMVASGLMYWRLWKAKKRAVRTSAILSDRCHKDGVDARIRQLEEEVRSLEWLEKGAWDRRGDGDSR